jgi:hypothetical protein
MSGIEIGDRKATVAHQSRAVAFPDIELRRKRQALLAWATEQRAELACNGAADQRQVEPRAARIRADRVGRSRWVGQECGVAQVAA